MSTHTDSQKSGERLAKRLAHAGIASRRDAEKIIAAGRVQVNGKIVTTPAFNVTATDKIVVDGKPVAAAQADATPRLFRFYKPTGVLCTSKDDRGRQTVFDLLPPNVPRLVLVGRLDFNSEGLLLLTNDGDLSRKLTLPATGLERTYRVRIQGKPQEKHLAAMRAGLKIEGIQYRPAEVTLDAAPTSGTNHWMTITLTEGKNREIRKMLEHFGFQVNRLLRTAYGPFRLGELPRGALVEVPQHTVKKLLKELEGKA
ncbi:MAG: pseudouridine synthase [Proteobacteria bacterium]|nr:pseudouridine synthase [Pseudomonadota bacterium]